MRLRLRETTALSRLISHRCGTALRRFAQEEDGVLIKPTIFIFLSMLAVGGIGIDLMRLERDRTELQYTLDRAVLAAADLDQTQTPSAVVLDYLTKSGLAEYYETPVSDIGLGYRIVTSTIDTQFTTHFMNFSGVGEIPIYATSTAEESIDGLEISLVLDVSGSMRSNNRLTNLKVAAKDFIDTMVSATTDGKMSISIIPYATQVSAPEELFEHYNVTDEHSYSNCVNFEDADFNRTTISTTAELERTMHFSPWQGSDARRSSHLVPSPVCSDEPHREMMLFQKNAATLKAFIQNLVATGNTSIDLGMKWATALLDPSARPAINAMTQGGSPTIPVDFSARPSNYNDTDTLKIVVLMTDGQNTSQYYVTDNYRNGLTDVLYDASYERYSIRKSSSSYYWPRNGYSRSYTDGSNAERLSFADLWAYTPVYHNYNKHFRPWKSSAKYTWYYDVFDGHGTSKKNTRTNNICDAAKAAGIIVYTIGFEAPSGGQTVLRKCASSDAHYFDVRGLEISDAFASIATSIRQLRLTQ